jgi:DNA gyrase inhibitor GyrI
MRALIVVQLVLAGAACLAAKAQQSAGSVGAAKEEITVKQTVPAQVVYLVHVGPYWTVGPRFAELREYMLTHGQFGPIYARYLDGPGEVPAKALRTEVGFFVQGNHGAEPPFETAERPSELVATMTVDRPSATVSHQYAVMRRWASMHDYVPAGPVTEIYALPTGPESKAQPTEVQMVIAKVEPPVEPSTAKKPAASMKRERPEVADLPTPDDTLVESGPTSAEAALGIAAANGENVGAANAPSDPLPMLGGDDAGAKYEQVPPPATMHAYYAPVRTTPPNQDEPPRPETLAPESVAADCTAPSNGPVIEMPHQTEADAPKPSPVDPPTTTRRSHPSLAPVEVLIRERRFDRVAAQLLPDDQVMSPQFEVWIGQVVYRLTAITSALERRGAEGQNEVLIDLGKAIEKRYLRVSKRFHTNPLSQPAWRLEQPSDPEAVEKKAIMRALELMMGRLAVGSLDESSSLDQVVTILQRVQDVREAE